MEKDNKSKILITIVSVVIPTVVFILFNVKLKDFGFNVEPLSFLPPIYAGINGLTAFVLVAAVYSIKKGNKKVHSFLMNFAIFLSICFYHWIIPVGFVIYIKSKI